MNQRKVMFTIRDLKLSKEIWNTNDLWKEGVVKLNKIKSLLIYREVRRDYNYKVLIKRVNRIIPHNQIKPWLIYREVCRDMNYKWFIKIANREILS